MALTLRSSRRAHLWVLLWLTATLIVWGQTLSGGSPASAAGALEPDQTQTADAAMRDTLQRYSAALESRDPEAVRKVHPAISLDALTKAFRDMRELKVVIDTVRVLSTDGKSARVSCRIEQTLTPQVGSKQTTTVVRVVRLRRDAEVWVIDVFER